MQARNSPTIIVPRVVHDEPSTPSGRLTSLVFVIAESLEATFGDSSLVGEDLTPALTELERESVRFSNMIQLPRAS